MGMLRGPGGQSHELVTGREGADPGLCSSPLGVQHSPCSQPSLLPALGVGEIFRDCSEEPRGDLGGGGQQAQLLRDQRSQQG